MEALKQDIISRIKEDCQTNALGDYNDGYQQAIEDVIDTIHRYDFPSGWHQFFVYLDEFLNYYPEHIFTRENDGSHGKKIINLLREVKDINTRS